MSRPYWITEGGNLGTFPELEFYSMPLEVYNPTGSPVTFTFLSGELPPGLQVVKSGILQGVPVVLNPIAVNESREYRFTIRASCQTPVVVVDRTFSFTVSNIIPPTIIPESNKLGEVFDGTLINIQLEAIVVNPNARLIWSLKSGELPPGIVLSSDGILSGFVGQQQDVLYQGRLGFDAQPTQVAEPFNNTANVTTPNGTTALTTEEPFGDAQQFEEFPYDYTSVVSTNRNYTFTVQVFDGSNFDLQTYSLNVVAKSTWTTDNDVNTVDDTFITVDADYKYNPIITTTITNLPTARQNSNYAFKFNAIDFYNSNLVWTSNITSVMPQMSLNSNTGWITGHVGFQTEYQRDYTFYVMASNVFTDSNNVTSTYSSIPLVCTLTVLGDINNKIVWNSPSALGTMINGSVSEFSVDAAFSGNTATSEDVYIRYKLLHGFLANGAPAVNGPPTTSPNNYVVTPWINDYYKSTRIGLPQGLKLLESGLVVGRASFMHFSLDNNETTIDGMSTTFDCTHTFTVQAEAVSKTTNKILVTGNKTFTISVNNLYSEPYENLYMKAFTTIEQRRLFRDIMSDSSMFPDSIIYRLDDPNFGKAGELKFLAMSGIAPNELSSYANSISNNHYNKTIKFSDVKTAIATDPNNNYAVKYEVVYVEIVDPFNSDNQNVSLETNLLLSSLNKIKNPYIDVNGVAKSMLYPNTFDNMQTRVESLGYSAQGVIPDWMTSVQEDKTVLGFKRALVLAYTKPGESKKIAYRIKNRGINFNVINFTIDRYQLDNSLSANYDIQTTSFVNGRATTFDVLSLIEQETYDVVNYASALAFDQINNKPYELIKANGGIDGVTAFQSGDRLIFGKQENITDGQYADGWVNYNVVGIYQSEYDTHLYDNSYIVPGYIEKMADIKEPTLITDALAGANTLLVPYISSPGYIGMMVQASSAIDANTTITDLQADNSTGNIVWKITLSNPLLTNVSAGDKIKILPYVTVVSNDGFQVTVSGLPLNITDRLSLFGRKLSGVGVPDNTLIRNIINDTIVVDNPGSEALSIQPGDLLGYSVINQRAGVWEIRIDNDQIVTLEFIKEIDQGSVIKVLGGQSFGACFLRYSNSIIEGNTVPGFTQVPKNITYNAGGGGNGTTFDMGGTQIIERRDSPGRQTNPIPNWQPHIYYPVGTIVKANNQTWKAVVDVMPTVNFVEKEVVNTKGRPTIERVYWKLFDDISVSGDKYLKFPQTGVFN